MSTRKRETPEFMVRLSVTTAGKGVASEMDTGEVGGKIEAAKRIVSPG